MRPVPAVTAGVKALVMAPAAEVDVTVIAYRHRKHEPAEWYCQVIVGCELVSMGGLGTIIPCRNLRPGEVLDAVTTSLVDSMETIRLFAPTEHPALCEAVRRLTAHPLALELVTAPVDIGDVFVWETPPVVDPDDSTARA